MQKQEYLYKGLNHAANLHNMRLKNKYCDVTIKIKGEEIRAHKVILAANLKYFEMMFSSDSFQESQGGVIPMKSVDKADLELFVSYAYTGEILLTNSNALNLLELANYLSEDDIKEACVRFLEKNLKADEACRAYKFANTIECLSLKNAAKAKIIANFGVCSGSAEFLNFHPDSLTDLLLNAKAQATQMQKMLFEGIMRWILQDAKDRISCMEDLFSSIDMTKLTADDVVSYLYENTVHLNDEFGITKNTIIYYKKNNQIQQREQEQILIALDITAVSFQFYNFIENKWSSLQKIPGSAGNIYQFSAVLNQKLYFISKSSEGNHLQVFNPLLKQIIRLHCTSSIFEHAALCACSRFIYICGGIKQNGSRSDQILRYDPQTNSVETLTPMACERSSAVAIFYEGYLYVLGGIDGSNSDLQSVEKYDPIRNEWTAVAPMCKKRFGPAVAILDGKLYACGGYSDNTAYAESSVEVYDSATNSWQLVASMNKERGYFLVVAHKDKLLAIGGAGEKTVEAYDPSKDQWQMDDEMTSGLQDGIRIGGLFPSSCISNTQ